MLITHVDARNYSYNFCFYYLNDETDPPKIVTNINLKKKKNFFYVF